ncbi:unnamed protein product, partial [Didymodactylos carnosus]
NLQNVLISGHSTHPDRLLVGIGEYGLDCTSTREFNDQIFVFSNQVILANRFGLPLVLHCRGREYFPPMLSVLQQHLHSADLNTSNEFLTDFENGYIGLNGSITYLKNIEEDKKMKTWLWDETILRRLILETDAPHLPPP